MPYFSKPTVEKVFWDFCKEHVSDSHVHEPRARELCEEIYFASSEEKVKLALALLESLKSEHAQFAGITIAKNELTLLLHTKALFSRKDASGD